MKSFSPPIKAPCYRLFRSPALPDAGIQRDKIGSLFWFQLPIKQMECLYTEATAQVDIMSTEMRLPERSFTMQNVSVYKQVAGTVSQ